MAEVVRKEYYQAFILQSVKMKILSREEKNNEESRFSQIFINNKAFILFSLYNIFCFMHKKR
jgi:hypothetical protein